MNIIKKIKVSKIKKQDKITLLDCIKSNIMSIEEKTFLINIHMGRKEIPRKEVVRYVKGRVKEIKELIKLTKHYIKLYENK